MGWDEWGGGPGTNLDGRGWYRVVLKVLDGYRGLERVRRAWDSYYL